MKRRALLRRSVAAFLLVLDALALANIGSAWWSRATQESFVWMRPAWIAAATVVAVLSAPVSVTLALRQFRGVAYSPIGLLTSSLALWTASAVHFALGLYAIP